jgi:cell division septation protein DedD
MKEQTFVFSGKAFAGLATALTAGGAMMFALGMLVGMTLKGAPLPTRTAEPTAGTTVASRGGTAASTDDPAAWPFAGVADKMAIDTTGANTPAIDSVPTALDTATSAPATRTKPNVRSGLQTVAYVATPEPEEEPAEDVGPYIVQVGSFRSARNAKSLAARLISAGYKPTIDVREDNGRPLHVVRLGRVIGRDRAERLAARIGDAERLVASVVAEHRGD